MKINYDLQMQKIIEDLRLKNKKPKLLLHACCAPCASACIERLIEDFDITVYFYNPNIDGKEEYGKRGKEVERLCNIFGIKSVIADFSDSEFFTAVSGRGKDQEGGFRCGICFNLRLLATKNYAEDNGFDYFATTLTLSPLKNAERINKIGGELEDGKVKYLPSDFKKRGGYLRSIELSKIYSLYRQNFCGCKFSKNR